jgi:hypothetical protein
MHAPRRRVRSGIPGPLRLLLPLVRLYDCFSTARHIPRVHTTWSTLLVALTTSSLSIPTSLSLPRRHTTRGVLSFPFALPVFL